MSKKRPNTTTPEQPSQRVKYSAKLFPGRDGLLAYIKEPESFPPSRVIYYNNDWVLIRDMYPKSSVHLLLLPRHSKFYNQHPFHAFQDLEFLCTAKTELLRAKDIVASELRRLYGKDSASEQHRIKAMELDEPPDELPPGRDWSKSILAGVHAHPSMNHLHIHVLSEDRHSECMKHRKHYNSFNTPFLVSLNDMPLEENDKRWHGGKYLREDLKCWRCGKNFENKFSKLKSHLDEEFEAWKKE